MPVMPEYALAPMLVSDLRVSGLALAVECPVMLAGHIADLAQDGLSHSPIGCLGSGGGMSRRLQQFLLGR